MPAVLAVLGAIVAVVAYLWVSLWVLGTVVAPVLGWVIIGGAGCGLLLAVAGVSLTLLDVGGLGAVTVTDADAARRLPRKRTPTLHPRDRAWPHYLFAQARDDLVAALVTPFEALAAIWTWTLERLRDHPLVLIFWPVLVAPLALLLAGTAATVAGVAALGVLLGATLLLARLGLVALVLALRALDHGIRRLRRAKATCHHEGCNERNMLPAFACPSCGRVHHDLRPGRQGALSRRCSCGTRLPTTVLRASAAGLVTVCQACDRPLHQGAATVTDVVVPVFGPTSAGKTRLVDAGLVALGRHLKAAGGSLTPTGAENAARLAAAARTIDLNRPTTKTPAGPRAGITVDLAAGRRRARLHLFDTGGESFADRRQAAELPYLASTEGLVFVLDPFSIREVAGELRADRATPADAAPADLPPEDSYQVTVQWLRDQGVPVDRLPLAVAVVKSDLLLDLHPAAALGPEVDSAAIGSWLREKALDNLVDSADRDFREVRYFLVSSLDNPAAGTSAAGPLLWLLDRSGVPVPGPREPVVS